MNTFGNSKVSRSLPLFAILSFRLNTYEGLVIVGVKLKDAGDYTCMAVNPAGSANRTIHLTVQGAYNLQF